MHEEPLYRVCPHRNVAAAYERFLGPDSAGLDRFFGTALERERFYGEARQQAVAALAHTRERRLHTTAEIYRVTAASVIRSSLLEMRGQFNSRRKQALIEAIPALICET